MIFILLAIFGCDVLQKQEKEAVIYARNLNFSIDGVNYFGVANVPNKTQYRIEAKFKNKFDKVRFLTCSREDWFDNRDNKFSYTWTLGAKEKEDYCYARVEFFNENGDFWWGVISPAQGKDENLKPVISCNGRDYTTNGQYLCHTRQGLNQRLVFPKMVDRTYVGKDCKTDPKIKTEDYRTFDYVAPAWFCTVVFASGKDLFRLTSFGYEQIYAKE